VRQKAKQREIEEKGPHFPSSLPLFLEDYATHFSVSSNHSSSLNQPLLDGLRPQQCCFCLPERMKKMRRGGCRVAECRLS